jgi:hypothetical protein
MLKPMMTEDTYSRELFGQDGGDYWSARQMEFNWELVCAIYVGRPTPLS